MVIEYKISEYAKKKIKFQSEWFIIVFLTDWFQLRELS